MTDHVSMDQKLQLIRQIRYRYQENQYDMSNRERILYGKTTMPPETNYHYSYGDMYEEPLEPTGTPISYFRLRFLVAVFLLAAVIFMDKSGIKVAGITTEEIFRAISADYDDKIEEWVEAISYNLPQR
ncbi:MAG: hypothetical protein HFH82_08285 [Lachnospiraceae bacterium]|nr:hypothetical protein [Lachnospiraceae bacterium]